MSKILNKLKKYTVKILLYLILFAFALATLLWMMHGDSSLSENLFASAVETLVTVGLIDSLLSVDRYRRMRALNKAQANGVKMITSLRIMGIINAFGFEYDKGMDTVSYSNTQIRKYVGEFFKDPRYKEFLKGLEDMEEALRPILIKLQEQVERELSGTRESLKEVKPYADPEIVRQIDDFIPTIIAQLTIVNFMYETIYILLPRDGHQNPKDNRDFWPFFKDSLFKDLVVTGEGKPDKKSFQSVIVGLLDLLMDIHEKAEENRLHYDI